MHQRHRVLIRKTGIIPVQDPITRQRYQRKWIVDYMAIQTFLSLDPKIQVS